MLSFAGEGYSRAFVANFEAVLQRIRSGVPVKLVAGPDDICAALGAEAQGQHCHDRSSAVRDRAARSALASFAGLRPLWTDAGAVVLDAPLIATLRAQFATGAIRSACAECEWSPLCDRIAASDFDGTRL